MALKHELFVMALAKSVFQVGLEYDGSDAVLRNISDNELNQAVNRRIMILQKMISDTMVETITPEIGQWLSNRVKTHLPAILKKLEQFNMQLDTFGLYLMYVNFCERGKPLDPRLQKYTAPELYFDSIELLRLVDIDEEAEAYGMMAAYKALEMM